MKVIRLNEGDIQRIVKIVLNEQEEKENIITSIDVGGTIDEGTDKINVGVLGALGCKNCEDPNGTYSVNRINYDKSKMEDALPLIPPIFISRRYQLIYKYSHFL